jgi:CRP/FNR family transcriptional regulator, cyclic AMP receptor protein
MNPSIAPNAPHAEPGSKESRYFAPMFAERDAESPPLALWADRAQDIQARPFDPAQGAALFIQFWGADRYVAQLSDDDLHRMCQYIDFVTVPVNQEAISQDELGDYMIVVLEGILAVDRIQPWGGRSRLAEARAGDMLGEMSLLDAGARFSACTTLTPCTLAVVCAERLDKMVAEEPRLALALVASLSRRLSLRLRQVSARLSALLSRG